MRYAAIDIRTLRRFRPLLLLLVLAVLPFALSRFLHLPKTEREAALSTGAALSDPSPLGDVGGEYISDSDEYDGELSVPAYIRLDRISVDEKVTPPLESAYISSHFGYRQNPVTKKYTFHSGCDLAAPHGTQIHAMYAGEIITAGYDESGYGNYIIIDHPCGVQTLYAHCSELLCSKGDTVSKGECIALVGSTGNSTGAHLHVEFRLDGQRYDPEWILGGIYS